MTNIEQGMSNDELREFARVAFDNFDIRYSVFAIRYSLLFSFGEL
jgi:hypothetical protein